MKKYISREPDDTMNIGLWLGRILRPGDVVGLYGELGAGKTVMVKGIARAFGIEERDIISASFTIISQYPVTPPFSHIDLYRIGTDEDVAELGLWEHIGGDGVTVIEWAERAEAVLPDDMIKVRLMPVDKNIREIVIDGIDEEGRHNL
jgi:tRNA threonylcarbamoyladenosine biosynthesis protein TsaE